MSSSSPVQGDPPAPPSVDDIDEQWEKFAKDGCPDWWLMAKYTHGWLARTFPYVPFKDRAASFSGDAAAAGTPALTSASSVPTPAVAAEAQAGRRHSSSEVELLQVLPASQKASGSAQQQAQEQQQQQLRGRAFSLESARGPAAAGNADASSVQQQQQQNCGNPLKGLFACQCAAPAGVDKPVEEVHS